MKLIAIVLLMLGCCTVSAQQRILTEEEMMNIVMQFHPVARQAAIDVRIAKADILASRGGFDPELQAQNARKEFSGITYYNTSQAELKIPTWYGVDLFAGTERINGDRINPEETTGSITYLGLSVQPLQNLLMDKRRATLLQAKIFHQLSAVERRIVLNDLVREALYDYWDWWEKYHIEQLMKTALQNAEERLKLVRTAVQLGDRAPIDTLEAFTQVQFFQLKVSEAYQELVKSNLLLSTFLWTENAQQAVLPADVVPQAFNPAAEFRLDEVLNFVNTHPELAQYEFKLRSLQVERKLAFQSLLPDVKIKYNQMAYDASKVLNGAWFENNYRYGINVAIPLRLSEGRGYYQKAKLKIEGTRLEQSNKQVQLFAKVKQYFTDWQQTSNQLGIQLQMLNNVRALQKGEEVRFTNGESSLFLINAREQKTIETEQKVIELKAKTQKSGVGLKWSAGVLGG